MRTIKFIYRVVKLAASEDCTPASYRELQKRLEQDIEITDAGNGDSVNIGTTTPTPANTGKPWIARDQDGFPLGLLQFFRNRWVNMGFIIGDQIFFHGPVAGITEPWFLADGNNGTANRLPDMDQPNNLFIKEFRGFS